MERAAPRPGLASFRRRLLFRGVFLLLAIATVALAIVLLQDEKARSYADYPGGHGEGYPDTQKQLFRRFYASIADPALTPDYPQMADGLRQLRILDAELASNKAHAWVDVPA